MKTVLHFIAKPRFNTLDLCWILPSSTLISEGSWLAAISVVAVGAMLSSMAESAWGEKKL